MEAVHTAERLKELQTLPLYRKIQITQVRIIEWYQHYKGNVYVSFSGGKDSTVLAHLVHHIYPDVPLVFCNTGLEYPEIQSFAREMGATFVRPKMMFNDVVSQYGYPLISKEVADAVYYSRKIVCRERERETTADQKRKELQGKRTINRSTFDRDSNSRRQALQGTLGEKSMFNKTKWFPLVELPFQITQKCCAEMKKKPFALYKKEHGRYPIVGTMADESLVRKQAWIRHGCNSFRQQKASSQPLSFWTEQDILHYIVDNGLKIASVYGDIVGTDKDGLDAIPLCSDDVKLHCTGCSRTGCIFCGFGFHLEKGETRFQKLAKTHPKQYEYCMNGGQWIDNPAYDESLPTYDGDWLNWNPKKIWTPSSEGLGMRKVFDMVNEIYGKDFYRYE